MTFPRTPFMSQWFISGSSVYLHKQTWELHSFVSPLQVNKKATQNSIRHLIFLYTLSFILAKNIVFLGGDLIFREFTSFNRSPGYLLHCRIQINKIWPLSFPIFIFTTLTDAYDSFHFSKVRQFKKKQNFAGKMEELLLPQRSLPSTPPYRSWGTTNWQMNFTRIDYCQSLKNN